MSDGGLKVEIGNGPRNAEQIQLRVDWAARQVGAVKLGIPTKIQIQGSPDDTLSGVISGLSDSKWLLESWWSLNLAPTS